MLHRLIELQFGNRRSSSSNNNSSNDQTQQLEIDRTSHINSILIHSYYLMAYQTVESIQEREINNQLISSSTLLNTTDLVALVLVLLLQDQDKQ